MAGRGFYVNFKVPELETAMKILKTYDAKTVLRIEKQVSDSTKAIRKGVARRIHDVSGYLRKHTSSSFNVLKVEGTVREKAPHAHLVEFGHKGPAPAPEHPTMRPAFEDERPNLVNGLARAVKP